MDCHFRINRDYEGIALACACVQVRVPAKK